jgi:uroporphyrinogen-III decarboxylase
MDELYLLEQLAWIDIAAKLTPLQREILQVDRNIYYSEQQIRQSKADLELYEVANKNSPYIKRQIQRAKDDLMHYERTLRQLHIKRTRVAYIQHVKDSKES